MGKGNPSARFVGSDGREYVSVHTGTHRAFAEACLAEMSKDGRDRRWMLKHGAITVPVEVLDAARARLEPEEPPPD